MSSYLDLYEPGYYSPSDKTKQTGIYPRYDAAGYLTVWGPGPNDWSLTPSWGMQGGSYRSRGGGGAGGGTRTSVSSVQFTQPRPQAPELPTLEFAKPDKRAMAALAQKAAAPGIRSLREAVQRAAIQTYENPNVRRMTLREALQGYGAGLEKVLGGAQQQARQEHMQELAVENQQRQLNWRTQVERLMDSYNKAFNEYLASATKTTQVSTGEGGEGGLGSDWVYRMSPFGTMGGRSPEPSFDRQWAEASMKGFGRLDWWNA
ncbi:MAG: hypothetical protein WHT06_15840 [Desulfobacterales bacterium]